MEAYFQQINQVKTNLFIQSNNNYYQQVREGISFKYATDLEIIFFGCFEGSEMAESIPIHMLNLSSLHSLIGLVNRLMLIFQVTDGKLFSRCFLLVI